MSAKCARALRPESAAAPQRRDENLAVAVDQRRDRVREDRPRIREQAAPVPRVMRAVAQVDGQIEIERAARAQETMWAGRPTRAGPSEAIITSEASVTALTLAQCAQPRRSSLLAHFRLGSFDIEAEPAARREHASDRGQIDAVLALLSAVPRPHQRSPSTTIVHGDRPARHWWS